MSGERKTVRENIDFIFLKAIEKRASFFVLVINNAGLVATYYRNEKGHITITPMELSMSTSESFACLGFIKVNSGIDPVVPRGVEIIQRKVLFVVGQIEQKICLACIPSDVIGSEIIVINLIY